MEIDFANFKLEVPSSEGLRGYLEVFLGSLQGCRGLIEDYYTHAVTEASPTRRLTTTVILGSFLCANVFVWRVGSNFRNGFDYARKIRESLDDESWRHHTIGGSLDRLNKTTSVATTNQPGPSQSARPREEADSIQDEKLANLTECLRRRTQIDHNRFIALLSNEEDTPNYSGMDAPVTARGHILSPHRSAIDNPRQMVPS